VRRAYLGEDSVGQVQHALDRAKRERKVVIGASIAALAAAVILVSVAVAVFRPASGSERVSEVAIATPVVRPEPKTLLTAPERAVQAVSVGVGGDGYEPTVVEVKAGEPIILTIDQGEGCAAGFLMPQLGITADNSQGPVSVEIPPLEAGEYGFSCGMEMAFGVLVAR